MNSKKHTGALVKADYMKSCADKIEHYIQMLNFDCEENPGATYFARTIAKQLKGTVKLLQWGAEEVVQQYGDKS